MAKNSKDEAFKKPTLMKITGRTSSITNAFGNGIIPSIQPSDEEIDEALNVLGMTRENVRCAYCGAKATEWDHFHPLIVKKKPTGYITEIHNLVPACGKCNQSKGNKPWKDWMRGNAKLSPKGKMDTKDLNERVQKLEDYENKFKCTVLDFANIPGLSEKWALYWKNHDKLLEKMREYQGLADEIQKDIEDYVNKNVIK